MINNRPYVFHEMKPSEIALILLLIGGINLGAVDTAKLRPSFWKRVVMAWKVLIWE